MITPVLFHIGYRRATPDRTPAITPDDHGRPFAGHPELSEREREVVRLISEDRTTRQIARQLNLSEHTVHTHRQRLMDKLDRHGVASLTKFAIRTGLTTL